MRTSLFTAAALLVVVAGFIIWMFGGNSTPEESSAQVFLTNTALAGEGNECTTVFPVQRNVVVATTPEATVRAAVEALLAGATVEEIADGYGTTIPSGVQLNSVQVNDYGGVATVDFSNALTGGGSCRVTSIRTQIVSTVDVALAAWYPDRYTVRITVDGGNPDEALQP